MFGGSEYASYVELCRALRLERKWEDGDWFWRQEYDVVLQDPYVGCYGCSELDQYHTQEMVWLPRLDQWLAMLEEAGVGGVTLRRWRGAYMACIASSYAEDIFPTREEACARLFMAVTGLEAARA